MNEKKMREEFEEWVNHPAALETHSFSSAVAGRYIREEIQEQWEAWKAACASKQKEIDELKKQLRLAALEELEKPPVDPDEVYSPNTKVINE